MDFCYRQLLNSPIGAYFRGLLLTMLVLSPAACVAPPALIEPEATPYYPMVVQEQAEANGAVYQEGRTLWFFEDLRASRPGDIVTVLLVEQTDAEKKSGTQIGKSNNNNITNPLLAGKTASINGDATLGFDLQSSHEFTGESDSNQSNKLQGSITVTVVDVLAGGNLLVQGEKWIRINQGKEYIRLQGVIRPVDIGTDNVIESTRIAGARIAYSGTGTSAQVNSAGWLSRFFISPVWPF